MKKWVCIKSDRHVIFTPGKIYEERFDNVYGRIIIANDRDLYYPPNRMINNSNIQFIDYKKYSTKLGQLFYGNTQY